MKKRLLFIDRDGTIISETLDEQIDAFEKLIFLPKVLYYLGKIAEELSYELVMVTNQDGLGTEAFPEDTFWPVHNFVLKTLENEGIHFARAHIDRTFPSDNAPTRKPGTAMLVDYFSEDHDLENSYIIGDRLTDMELAKNLGAKGIFIDHSTQLGTSEITVTESSLESHIALKTDNWKSIYEFLKAGDRSVKHSRTTKETDISIELDLDGTGKSDIDTGIGFFDHMLDQLARHGEMDLSIKVKGDLEVDEHHTIEDTAIALGEAFAKTLGDKLGLERYGFCLPMDDCLAQTAIDFGGRSWVVWEADFTREMIGKMPTEMFFHFFRSFADGAGANINIKAEGANEHHKIEAIFKSFAKAVRAAIRRDLEKQILPSTKGIV